MSSKQQKLMVQPITVLFRYLQQQTRVSLWLYDNLETRIEGRIVGFDEFMNVVISEAEEVYTEKCRRNEGAGKIPGARKDLGRILLKGDNITLIQPVV
ncbi:Sm-like ribonucleo protein [Jaminaea rosea]|uniref:Small nuclear ribonucleoprotein E n=1 Tax=Jaminaea rosea TaxID=1569628 RepID=A0A316V1S5_9BASI|nr:Sm-like ribonucleo protein [Jaminaea rosea]PWN30133.1 Sm-like ribonucleo protein [Jaminaea rosea]